MAELDIKGLFEGIEATAKTNNLEISEIYTILETSIMKAFHSKFDPDAELELTMDKDKEIFELINNSKMVIDGEVLDEHRAIYVPLKEALKIKPGVKDGDMISEKVEFAQYAKIVAGSIKQMLTQNVREKKKAAVYAKYKGLIGEMIPVTVSSVSNTHAIFVLDDGTTAFMPESLMNKKIRLKSGQRLNIYVEDVLEESRDAQIIVSNGSTEMVKRVLEVQVPEIADGTIEIVKIARVAGERSKVAVKTSLEEVDPVGAIIGQAGQRIKTIIAALDGERIDVIKYSSDINEFIAAAMAPARVVSINDVLDAEGAVKPGHKNIVTPNRHQTLAIGKRGMNIKLVVELTNTRMNIYSIDQAREDNIDILWNANVKEDELAAIEASEGRNFNRNTDRPRNNNGNSAFDNRTSLPDFNDEISSFNDDMSSQESFQKASSEDDRFEIPDDLFTKYETEEIQKIEEIEADDFDFSLDDIDDDFK